MEELGPLVRTWIEWQQPYWLLLLLPLMIGFVIRRDRAFMMKKIAHLDFGTRGVGSWLRFNLPRIVAWMALMALVLALGDVTRGYEYVAEQASRHRIFLWVDSSSSMYGISSPFPSITCTKNFEKFPRIKGACRAAIYLIEAVRQFASQKKNAFEHDLIGIGQFGLYSYVVAYPSYDYDRLRGQVASMEFKSGALGIYTNLHVAMWDMYLMALDRNLGATKSNTQLSGNELRMLAKSLAPEGQVQYVVPREIRDKLIAIRRELRDTVFVIITDAHMGQIDNVMDKPPYSLRKQMQLAAFLELPMIYLSVDEFHQEMKRLARLTGFGPPDAKSRGDYLMVRRDNDFAHIEELVAGVLETRFSMKVAHSVERRESYAEWFAGAALCFAVLALVLRYTIAKTLTGGGIH